MANYNIVQGDAFSTSYFYETPSGSAVNLGGGTFTFEVRDDFGGQTLLYSSSVSIPTTGSVNNGAITVLSASSGTISVIVPSSATNYFNLPKSAFQARFTDSSGNPTTFETGYFVVNPGVIQ
jgi:hypothetical protein